GGRRRGGGRRGRGRRDGTTAAPDRACATRSPPSQLEPPDDLLHPLARGPVLPVDQLEAGDADVRLRRRRPAHDGLEPQRRLAAVLELDEAPNLGAYPGER